MNTAHRIPVFLVELIIATAFLAMVVVFIYQETVHQKVDQDFLSTLHQFHEIYLGALDYQAQHQGRWPETIDQIDSDHRLQCSALDASTRSKSCGDKAAFSFNTDDVFFTIRLNLASTDVAEHLLGFLNGGRLTAQGIEIRFPILERQSALDPHALQVKQITGIQVAGDKEKDIRTMKPLCPNQWLPRYEVAHKHFFNGYAPDQDCFIEQGGSAALPGDGLFFDEGDYNWHPLIRTDSLCPAPKAKNSGELLGFFFCTPEDYNPQRLLKGREQ